MHPRDPRAAPENGSRETSPDPPPENRTANASGKVVLEFRLHPDGRITGMTNVQNEVSDFMENMCERAILDPEPFQPWPREMRLDIPADYRDIQFTFFYDLQ